MIKAGVLGGVVGLIYAMGLAILSPLCTVCFMPVLGLGVGYLAGWISQPLESSRAVTAGVVSGGLTGLGASLGQLLAGFVFSVLFASPEQLNLIMREFGFTDIPPLTADQYWQSILLINSFCSITNWILLIGLSITGCMFWMQRRQKNRLTFSIKG
jgi:MFS family permease